MTKDVTVAELEEHLAERLEEVRGGTTLRVVVGDTPIAKITPEKLVDELTFRPALRPMPKIGLPPLVTKRDILEYLEEERADK
jgi:antitoxin (DNA-binding transcriptional repressor) of toxin-antitoxin stability system